jgi:CPA2 family monovalent cation:H+ antiporter-2
MHTVQFLEQLLIVLTATISIVFFFQKIRLPTIVGFLIAGVIIGPSGLGLVERVGEIEVLAEIGVVLLLFTIGVEFSLAAIFSTPRRTIWAGCLQVILTVLVVLAVARALGMAVRIGVFYGFLGALSSTAIVLRIYNDRGEISSMHGRLASGVLIFQDLCIVPMMLLVPILGESGQGSAADVIWALLKPLLALSLIVGVARRILPWLLHQVALLRNREIFMLFVILVCLGTAWITSASGLSLALGALVAGMVISESELSHQIVVDVLPLRDCFSGIFFISIGMLLNLNLITQDLLTPLFGLLLVVLIKGLIVFVVFWGLYRSIRLGVILALSLAQIGEFSFILAQSGMNYALLSAANEQTFLAASILSMIATPFLVQAGHGFGYGLQGTKGTARKLPDDPSPEESKNMPGGGRGHVIIVGYGLNGQNLARVLKEVGIPYRILEMNPDTVNVARMAGEPIIFGDGTRPEILQQVGIQRAQVLVAAVSDPIATARIVAQARRTRADLYIIVRTRYVAEIDHLYNLGAKQVIPEEFETSVEIFARVLQEYHIPRNVIALQVDLIRKEHYGTLRGLRLQGKRLDELSQFLAGTTADIFSLLEGSPAVGKSLGEIDLGPRTGATLIAVVREGKSFHNVAPDFTLENGDRLVLLGGHKALDHAGQILSPLREG